MNLIDFLKQQSFKLNLEKNILAQITGTLKVDSRTIEPGDVYLALPLLNGNSHETYVKEAQQRGAVLILNFRDEGRRFWAKWAKNCSPRQPETCVGVTGTNGKSSVVSFTRQLWEAAGLKAASLGTLGLSSLSCGVSEFPLVGLTSPDPITLHECLNGLAGKEVQHLALEVSSHGLDQHRLDEVQFAAAAFMNLHHEHLDYHGSMGNYFAAKCRLFTELLPASGTAILNRDNHYGQKLGKICAERGQSILWFGRKEGDINLAHLQAHPKGLILDVSVLEKTVRVDIPLIGAFQAENVLAALGLVVGSGMKPEQAIEGLKHLRSVPGRMEPVGQTLSGGLVFVDYAHKPYALENVLKSVRAHISGKVLVVFGCGGNRDTAKRKMMGAIAAQWADEVIVTDDNPRQEKASDIRAEILRGCPGAEEICSRREAIAYGLKRLNRGDVCIIAGKGHEQGQIMGSVVLPFDDREVARELLRIEGGEAA
ncbi:UDP-N-acetylmuramoyl-L-alanyl-D-glutamate--2, 6-diaminopimelate ligase [Caedimonas varicaedens]|jgi:UDP-N-acetylmuramoyl-L-alanyl-D-glutamate--2,6-diaminopimelate ligase|uniref:UDP-N-acetylmuramoyl-L-alanyl-D-glutamate--2,6-diaminopimelate ligase n=1 Tax=Caedimonas varicaedens TaxID=1629334 RepID=A0A0K8MAM8_9PROT|nr:UDP-N-acetylmuramoyl-L-alanyl-D-glutamate--2, 6-diaminopimelate ligase [Caedimonas varicaedens]